VLIDFGAARQVIGDLTQTLTAILKPGYAPVEQYADSPEMVQGPWTDVYALAATMHFAITGSTPPAAVGRLMEDRYVPLSSRVGQGYSPGFLSALDRALRVKPRERTASMTELRAELGLDAIGEKTLGLARTEHAQPRARGPERPPGGDAVANTWRPSAIAGAVAVGVGVAGSAWWWSGRSPELPAKNTVVMEAAALQAPPSPASVQASVQAPLLAAAASSPSASLNANAGETAPVVANQANDRVRAQFQQIVAAQTPDFVVEATATKPVLKIGRDLFGWRVRSTRDGFVHVLSLGPDGSLLLVFPNLLDSNHRILAGQTLTLPRNTWPLAAAEPPGREELLVFVSASPRTFDGLGKRYLNSFLRLSNADAAASMPTGRPDETPWLLGSVSNCAGQSCKAYGAATFTVDVRR
jgi:Domain of unknown function (DUF4384)